MAVKATPPTGLPLQYFFQYLLLASFWINLDKKIKIYSAHFLPVKKGEDEVVTNDGMANVSNSYGKKIMHTSFATPYSKWHNSMVFNDNGFAQTHFSFKADILLGIILTSAIQ